jgi:hypothetical protein
MAAAWLQPITGCDADMIFIAIFDAVAVHFKRRHRKRATATRQSLAAFGSGGFR